MKLSIIVPVYNVEKYLHKCVDSILAQTLTDFECILVDDGSTDNCPAICDEYAKKDPRIIVIHKENGGQADARNKGLDIAQGDYIGFVDSDDYIDTQMYSTMYNIAVSNTADIVESKFKIVDSNGIPIDSTTTDIKNTNLQKYTRSFLLENFNSHGLNGTVCDKIFHKDVFKNIRFPLGKIYEDTYVIPDITEVIDTAIKISDSYYNYRQHKTSTVHAPFNLKAADAINVYDHLFCFFKEKHITNQAQYALEKYVNTYSKTHFLIYIDHKEYKKDFKPYRKQALSYLPEILKNPYICRVKKLTFLSMHLFPKWARKTCMRAFPEMLGLKYDEWLKLKDK